MATVASAPRPADQSRPKPSPAPSAISTHSLGDNATFSLPPSSLASGESSGSEQPPSACEITSSGSQKKKPISQRLTRMFSSKNTVADTALVTAVSPPSAQTSPTDPTSLSPPSTMASNATKSELRPAAPRRDRSSSNGSSKKSFLSAGNSSDKLNAAERKDPKAAAKGDDKNGTGPVSKRFIMRDDGSHEHFLKVERRQEKLGDMFRSLLSGRKKDGEPQEHQLSLVSSWVDQVKNEKAAPDQKGGPNTAASLVEKYGKCQEVVGRGAFGIVRISHKTDRADPKKEQLYAVKEFRRRPSESPKKYNKRLTSEFCISSALRHPNVIHTLDLLKDAKGDYCEVMEYCAGGDLYTLVLAAGKLEVVEADCYFKQLMRGVEYIHEMGVAHRDLKPENLLLTTHGSLKITDFGNGECFRMAWEQEPHMVAGLCGSAPYIAPEEYVDNEFDPRAVDVWACGVIYMAMRTGRHLWRVAQKEEDEFYRKYLQGRRDEDGYGPIETLHRARCRNVIYSILDPNPARRITASQILRSEWGREIKLCKAGEEGF